MRIILYINQCYLIFMGFFFLYGPLMGYAFARETEEFKNCIKLFKSMLFFQLVLILISVIISRLVFNCDFISMFINSLKN